jgi:hypothetical protein
MTRFNGHGPILGWHGITLAKQDGLCADPRGGLSILLPELCHILPGHGNRLQLLTAGHMMEGQHACGGAWNAKITGASNSTRSTARAGNYG